MYSWLVWHKVLDLISPDNCTNAAGANLYLISIWEYNTSH